MLKLRQIEVLHAVLSCGSVTGAAALLHISQPAVSKTLQQAQRQLGLPLFTRVAGRLQPTAEALDLWSEIDRMAQQLQAIQGLADNLSRGQDATLRVGTLVSLSQALLPPALAAMRRRRPRLAFELHALHTADLVSHLLLRDIDVGIDFGGADHPAIRRTVLVATESLLAAPRGWLGIVPPGSGITARVTAAVVAAHPVVAMVGSDPVAGPLEAAGFFGAATTLRLRAQTRPACLALVEQGVGVGILDPFTAAAARRDRVDLFGLSPPMPLTLNALVARARPRRALSEALIAEVTAAAQSQLAALGLPAAPALSA